MSPKWRYLVVALLLTAVAGEIAWLYPVMAPMGRGNTEQFWRACCAVRYSPDTDAMCCGYDERWYYYWRWSDGWIGRVPPDEIVASYPAAVAALDRRLAGTRPAAGIDDWHGPNAYWMWRTLPAAERTDPKSFVQAMEEQRKKAWASELPIAETQAWFLESRQRAERYWVNALLEFLFLGGLIIFAAWPWLRRQSRWRVAAHLGLTPFLLFLPAWLGYAAAGLDARPRGGILYPFAVHGVQRAWPESIRSVPVADPWLVSQAPQVLAPLLQLNEWILPHSRRMGPCGALFMGQVIFGLALLAAWLGDRRRRRHRRDRGVSARPATLS